MEFSLAEIIELLLKRFVFIFVCIFMGLSIFYISNKYFTKPIYTASLQMYVSSNEMTTSTNLNELNYAQKVVTTYINFLQTKIFYKKVIEDCGLDYSSDQLSKMTVIQAVNNTEIFRISVTSYSPNDSFKLVQSMQNVAPELIKSIKNAAEINVIDPVVIPEKPSGPNILLNTMIGGMLGFFLSVLAAFLWEIINVSVKNQDDLKKKHDLPILGAIPNYDINRRKIYTIFNYIPILRKNLYARKVQSILNDESKFIVNEAFNSLRTNLRFTLRKDGCKKLIISSPISQDGKSATSSNIAFSIAQTGAKVLLIDCDLRKGTLHNYFKVKSSPGLSDTLSGMINDKYVIQNTLYENLQVITMGSISPNPTELLSSVQMEELITNLEKDYDYIIIDTPPVNVVSDALSLVKMSDGVLIIVREGITSHPNITTAITKYKFSGANILGFVINGVYLNQGNKSKSQYYYSRNKGNDS